MNEAKNRGTFSTFDFSKISYFSRKCPKGNFIRVHCEEGEKFCGGGKENGENIGKSEVARQRQRHARVVFKVFNANFFCKSQSYRKKFSLTKDLISF